MDIANRLEKLIKTNLTDAQVNELQTLISEVMQAEQELARAKQTVKMYRKLYDAELDAGAGLSTSLYTIVGPVQTQDSKAIDALLKAMPLSNASKAIADTVNAALAYR